MKFKSLTIAFLISSTACALSSPSPGSSTGGSSITNPSGGGGNATPPGSTGTGPVVRYIGRVDSTTPVLSWPGNAVQTVFTGTKGTVSFTTQQQNNYVDVSIDGGTPIAAQVSSGTPIAFGPVASGTHTVTVTKRSEATYGTLQLAGFNTDGTGQPTTVPDRRIEFIGDSITAGYGVDGTAPCTETPGLENSVDSYAHITGANLNADVSMIAWSGKGVARNVVSANNSDTITMPVLWMQTSAADTSATYTFPASSAPQAVVINLGTNDFSYLTYDASGNPYNGRSPIDQATYVNAMVSLVQNVMTKYPGVQVVLCSSPMLSDSYPSAADKQHTTELSYLQAVATQIGGSNIHVLDFPTQAIGNGLNGCDDHPSKTQQQAMATALTAQLKTILAW